MEKAETRMLSDVSFAVTTKFTKAVHSKLDCRARTGFKFERAGYLRHVVATQFKANTVFVT